MQISHAQSEITKAKHEEQAWNILETHFMIT